MDVIKYRTLIIDDERPAREYIKELLQFYSGYIQIIGEASDGIEAINLIERLKPDLIFLDIQMPKKNGFEVLQSLNYIPLIVFCTAFDDYALEAFKTNSIDYLVKPINPQRLQTTISKLQNLNELNGQNKIKNLIESIVTKQKSSYPTSIPVKLGDRIVFVKIDDVSFFKAKDKYIEIHTVSNKIYLFDQSLNSLELKLPHYFLRVQRSYIVNTNKILEIRKYTLGKYLLLLDNVSNTKIITGKSYSAVINGLTKI